MMSDTFQYGTCDRKLATALFKHGWTQYVWQETGGDKAAIFTIPVSDNKRFRRFLEQYGRK
jgi:hypothetical protein